MGLKPPGPIHKVGTPYRQTGRICTIRMPMFGQKALSVTSGPSDGEAITLRSQVCKAFNCASVIAFPNGHFHSSTDRNLNPTSGLQMKMEHMVLSLAFCSPRFRSYPMFCLQFYRYFWSTLPISESRNRSYAAPLEVSSGSCMPVPSPAWSIEMVTRWIS